MTVRTGRNNPPSRPQTSDLENVRRDLRCASGSTTTIVLGPTPGNRNPGEDEQASARDERRPESTLGPFHQFV